MPRRSAVGCASRREGSLVFSSPRPRGRYLLARTGSVATEGDDSRCATRTGTGAARRKKPVGYEQRTPAGTTSGTSAQSATRIRRRSLCLETPARYLAGVFLSHPREGGTA